MVQEQKALTKFKIFDSIKSMARRTCSAVRIDSTPAGKPQPLGRERINMIRDDLSDRLVHLTKGKTEKEAAERFMSIVRDKALLGGTRLIRGDYQCVCFTESPISKLGAILAEPSIHGVPYAPFGVMLTKTTLFAAGGRPVIYQPESEFEMLHQSQRYRHKDYDPMKLPDYSWEREWRVPADRFTLDPDAVTLVVPNRIWSDFFFKEHAGGQASSIMFFGEDAMFGIRKFPWHFLVLEDLGMPVKFSHVP